MRNASRLCTLCVLLLPAAAFSQSSSKLSERIDDHLAKNLTAAKATASPSADDAEFLRRAYLDLHGVVPPLNRAIAFLDSKDPGKRGKLIDELLASPQYGRHFALVWYNRMVPRAARNRGAVSETLQDWLAEQFNQSRGWDRTVADMLLSEGERDKNPGTVFYLAALDDAKPPQPEPAKVAASIARLFLGVRLECCQCHDHPFTPLKQSEFWGMAAFFTNVRADIGLGNKKILPVVTEGVNVGIFKIGMKGPRGPAPISTKAVIEIPETNGKKALAKFLGGAEFDSEGKVHFRPALVKWMTAPNNAYFARATVNRTWAHFFGRGLVDPVDDMRPEHPPTHPELFDMLTQEFIASGYDLKYLMRSIANTQAYQRTSTASETNLDPALYAHMPPRVMTADQLYDSLTQILQHPIGEHIPNAGQKRKYGDARERFRAFFHNGADDDNIPVPAYGHGIPQVLRLMNEPALTDGSKVLQKLTAQRALGSAKAIETLYLTTLSRYPTAAETKRVTAFLAEDADRQNGLRDLLWVLLNSGEFLHNH